MKVMMDLVKKAIELNALKSQEDVLNNPNAFHYIEGQMQILEYFIENSVLIDEKEDEVEAIYDASFEQYKELGMNDEQELGIKMETFGAADILAWILDLPEDEHEQRKKDNGMVLE